MIWIDSRSLQSQLGREATTDRGIQLSKTLWAELVTSEQEETSEIHHRLRKSSRTGVWWTTTSQTTCTTRILGEAISAQDSRTCSVEGLLSSLPTRSTNWEPSEAATTTLSRRGTLLPPLAQPWTWVLGKIGHLLMGLRTVESMLKDKQMARTEVVEVRTTKSRGRVSSVDSSGNDFKWFQTTVKIEFIRNLT
jgi:hypothetical protein